MKYPKFLKAMLFLPLLSFSQKATIGGYLKDAKTGEALIGATAYIVSLKIGAAANEYGFYSLTVPKSDSLIIVFNYIGYVPQIKKVLLDKDYSLNIKMQSATSELDEVVVSGEKSNKNVEKAEMGVINIPIEKIKSMPVVFGESDVLKVIQLLPGVQSGNEGTTGFFVRGGNADQNLVQLDEATVYNPNHLFGLFSTFNTRALNNVELIKGGFPAQYGGRLSSVLNIKMKEGNNNDYQVQGGIGLISSQLTIEGPIKKEKISFIVSARTSYIDWLIKPFLKSGVDIKYNFYDLNAKVNWQISKKDRIFLSGFKGSDNAHYKESNGISYNIVFGNSTATLRWNHIFNSRLFLNTSLIYNSYLQNVTTIQDNNYSQTYSAIHDVNGKTEFQYFPSPKHILKFGANYTNHSFLTSGRSETLPANKKVPVVNPNQISGKYFDEFALYINDEFTINKILSVNYGLRAPGFVSTKASYYKLEPRATIKIGIDSSSSIKACYTLMNQFIHLVPSTTAALPTDIWIPSTNKTKPQFSVQYALGYFKNFKGNKIETSVELYYKTMSNQVLFKEGYQLRINGDIDSGLVYGKGESYGAEFFIKKNVGKFTGWIAYTLSWNNQTFKDLNYGKIFPFKYDRRHVLSVTAAYELTKRWSLNAVFVFSSGTAFTVPTGRISVINGGSIFEGNYYIYDARNNYRLSPFHRLDLSASYKKKGKLFKRPFEKEWVFGIYNVYSRQNPYFIYFIIDPKTNEPKAKQVSLLPIIPSVSFNFKF